MNCPLWDNKLSESESESVKMDHLNCLNNLMLCNLYRCVEMLQGLGESDISLWAYLLRP